MVGLLGHGSKRGPSPCVSPTQCMGEADGSPSHFHSPAVSQGQRKGVLPNGAASAEADGGSEQNRNF